MEVLYCPSDEGNDTPSAYGGELMAKNKGKKRNKKNKEKETTFDIFVYGTLKVGGYLSGPLNKHRIEWCLATTRGLLYHNWRWPMLVPTANCTDIVHGEIHTYPEECLEILDGIEGFIPGKPEESLFVRRIIPVYEYGSKSREPREVFGYVWRHTVQDCCSVNSGSWRDEMNYHLHPGDPAKQYGNKKGGNTDE
jgi:gamma-glutamylcyclotransferase (GGCT)/AIG2-like uncharacterized protein YtfP